MRCSLCETLGHNKKGCPSARNQGGRAGTSSVGGETAENASSTTSGGRAGTSGNASAATTENASVAATGSATATSNMESGTFTQPITDPSTQQSTNIAGGPKRKTNEPRRCGANAGSKRPKATRYVWNY
uniref:Uncharacterized protein n=1 Tax=Nicotiana tabacum TaxID=4097 RepID=A0A1S4BGW2_TOBAC|nr:PREDICTED: uncharacterized protein LOC107808139 [Nicotiana tabacum]